MANKPIAEGLMPLLLIAAILLAMAMALLLRQSAPFSTEDAVYVMTGRGWLA